MCNTRFPSDVYLKLVVASIYFGQQSDLAIIFHYLNFIPFVWVLQTQVSYQMNGSSEIYLSLFHVSVTWIFLVDFFHCCRLFVQRHSIKWLYVLKSVCFFKGGYLQYHNIPSDEIYEVTRIHFSINIIMHTVQYVGIR